MASIMKITQKPQKPHLKIVYEGLCVIKSFLDIRPEEDDDNSYVESRFFTGPNDEIEWTLDVFAHGYKGHLNHVSLRLYNIDEDFHSLDELPDLRFVACIVDEDDKKYSTKWTTFELKNAGYETYFLIKEFVPRKDLQNNPKLLPEGELRILFELSFDTEATEAELMTNSERNQLKILNNVFVAGKYTDFKLVVNEKVFSVHRAILAARGPVFEAMFDSQMRESSEGIANIVDVDAAVMDKLLHFVYSGNVESIDDLADKLLVAADRYQIDELKLLCEEFLAKRLCLANVYDILRLADGNNAEQLKKKAIKFFHSNAKDLSSHANFKDHLNLLSTLLKTDIICALIDEF